ALRSHDGGPCPRSGRDRNRWILHRLDTDRGRDVLLQVLSAELCAVLEEKLTENRCAGKIRNRRLRQSGSSKEKRRTILDGMVGLSRKLCRRVPQTHGR